MDFRSKKLLKWDSWLRAGRAKMKEETVVDGLVRRRCYEIQEPSGHWVVHLNEWEKSESVNVWGPDGLAVIPPAEPSWEAMRASLSLCTRCGKAASDLKRAGFAGRWCQECRASHLHEVEYPGWTE